MIELEAGERVPLKSVLCGLLQASLQPELSRELIPQFLSLCLYNASKISRALLRFMAMNGNTGLAAGTGRSSCRVAGIRYLPSGLHTTPTTVTQPHRRGQLLGSNRE